MNEFQKDSFIRRNGIWLVVLAALVVFGILLSKGWDKVVNQEIDGKMETITGKFSCLPLRGQATSTAPELTEEEDCVLGIKTGEGAYFALDISRIQDANSDLKAEDTVAVTGFINTATSSAQWAAFSIVGIIQANTVLRTR